MNKPRLVLVDGHSLLFRAFYAYPMLSDAEGKPVNAIYGFAATLLSVIEELEPTYIAVVFDSKGPTLRKQQFEAYKAHRKPPPDELLEQLPRANEIPDVLNIPHFALEGYEGDDLIGTIAHQAKALIEKGENLEVVIVTGDLDNLQLVDDGKVHVFVPRREKKVATLYDREAVVEKLGVTVEQVPDYKGLAGDASDNIPGVKGIGPKTAVMLLQKYQTVEGIFKAVESGQAEKELPKGVFNKLKDSKEIALQSKELATILTNAPIKLVLDDCTVSGYDKTAAIAEFEKLGFKSLISRLPQDDFEKSVQDALF